MECVNDKDNRRLWLVLMGAAQVSREEVGLALIDRLLARGAKTTAPSPQVSLANLQDAVAKGGSVTLAKRLGILPERR